MILMQIIKKGMTYGNQATVPSGACTYNRTFRRNLCVLASQPNTTDRGLLSATCDTESVKHNDMRPRHAELRANR